MSRTLDAELARIRELAQAEVVCPTCGGKPRSYNPNLNPNLFPAVVALPCLTCHGTNKVPRYASLVEALTEPCHWDARDHRKVGLRRQPCKGCGGSGRVLRLDWQQGELAGVLLDWTDKNVPYEPAKSSPQLHTALVLCFREPDTNERATQVFVKFMEATHATE